MYFTPYVLLASADSSLDPLGFLRPGAELADLLFPQFTVLTNHPTYHGFLCFALRYLEKTEDGTGARSQQEKIRDMEILWGVSSLHAGGTAILNVNKYKMLAKAGLTLAAAQKQRMLYQRMNYGTLGHYTGPSIRWGLLAESDRSLTTLGENLAKAWNSRGPSRFSGLLTAWLSGEPVVDSHSKELKPYCVSSPPSQAEQRAWQDIIKHTCKQQPVSAPLWEKPVTSEILKLADDEKGYNRFFPSVCTHYADSPPLQQRLRLCQYFEEICALVQCVFDWVYVQKSRAEETVGQAFESKEQVLPSLKKSIKKFQAESLPSTLGWNLPERLLSCSSYAELEDNIIQHHGEHQKRKGAAAFMDKEKILVSGRVDEGRIAKLLEKLDAAPMRITASATYTYRRNWYFEKAQRWLQYAGSFPNA